MVSSFPSFGPLAYLVVQAVGQVVVQCAAGYILSYAGLLSTENQKFLSNLNIMVFMPCLVFMKLASQLTPDKLANLALIPVMFVIQTIIAWGAANGISRLLRLNSKQTNFVTAMSVFGNSNSLPVSLVISLSHTIPSLLWLEKFPNDKAGDVAARGILYLLIFQQLGQTIRWTWGFQVLLAPNQGAKTTSFRESDPEQGVPSVNPNPTIVESESDDDAGSDENSPMLAQSDNHNYGSHLDVARNHGHGNAPISAHSSSATLCADGEAAQRAAPVKTPEPESEPTKVQIILAQISDSVAAKFELLPIGVQNVIRPIWFVLAKIGGGFWANLNPPLAALLIAMLVASTPILRNAFFTPGTFVSNTITPAIKSMGAVSVPLSLVVLGSNICRVSGKKTNAIQLPSDADYYDGAFTPEAKAQRDNKLVLGSVLGRMLLPTLVSVPLLMLVARYCPVSIMQDPIFIVVCFLLVGAPTALQLSQICQINDVYMDVMARVLMHGYVFWIMPSTLILVGLAMMTLEWM